MNSPVGRPVNTPSTTSENCEPIPPSSASTWARTAASSWDAAARGAAGAVKRSAAAGSDPAAGAPELSAAIHLDDDRVALAAAGADRRAPEAAAAPAQLEHERAQDARAGGADGMAESNRATV